ncbi:MAG: heme exporter protein CcmB [Aquisalimonadaceae bacterium]
MTSRTSDLSEAAPLTVLDVFVAVLRRDVLIACRRSSEFVNPLMFFVIIVVLFPLALGSDPVQLRAVAPGVIWVAALLAVVLSLETIFRGDFEDGSLEQLLLSPFPTSVLVLAKIAAHWLVSGLPLLIISPLLGILLNLPAHVLPVLMFSLLLGTPVLSLLGAIGVALTVGLRRGGVLMPLLLLPLYVPVLIFGTGVLHSAVSGMPVAAHFYAMAALLSLAIGLAPLASAAALRVSLG